LKEEVASPIKKINKLASEEGADSIIPEID